MGEVIHGEYIRWVNDDMLHAVTDYALHKALYSGHNDHNYFEIAHNVKRLMDMAGGGPLRLGLYNFVDNHDVARIASKVNNKDHLRPIYILLYTLPGVPSIYYGSEFGIEGQKEQGSDASLRPQLNLEDFQDAGQKNNLTRLITGLGRVRQSEPALSYGVYEERYLTNRQYAFVRKLDGRDVIVTVNNDENPAAFDVRCDCGRYRGALTNAEAVNENGHLHVDLDSCSGEIWLPES
jgi:glycosidase